MSQPHFPSPPSLTSEVPKEESVRYAVPADVGAPSRVVHVSRLRFMQQAIIETMHQLVDAKRNLSRSN